MPNLPPFLVHGLDRLSFDRMSETNHITVFAIFAVLEDSGSSLFSLFSKNLEAHCFRCFGRNWKLTVLKESGSSLFSLLS